MNTSDMPSACPVPSAAPTRISLIHAASTDAPTRLPTARADAPLRPSCLVLRPRRGALEEVRMRLEEEDEIQDVDRQQHERRPEVHELLFVHRAVGREEAVERARHAEADRRDQHHRAVEPRRAGVVFLRVMRRPPRKNATPIASIRLARIAPMIDARTMSK